MVVPVDRVKSCSLIVDYMVFFWKSKNCTVEVCFLLWLWMFLKRCLWIRFDFFRDFSIVFRPCNPINIQCLYTATSYTSKKVPGLYFSGRPGSLSKMFSRGGETQFPVWNFTIKPQILGCAFRWQSVARRLRKWGIPPDRSGDRQGYIPHPNANLWETP